MKFVSATLAFLCLTAPALADITVSFPTPGAHLMSPFVLQAAANTLSVSTHWHHSLVD